MTKDSPLGWQYKFEDIIAAVHQRASDESSLIFIQSRDGAASAASAAQPFDAKCKSCHDFPQISFKLTFSLKNGRLQAKLSLDIRIPRFFGPF